jgi:hypothetical protein
VVPRRRRADGDLGRRRVVRPLALALPLLVVAAGLLAVAAVLGAVRCDVTEARGRRERALVRAVTGVLFLAQPAARLAGRLRHGLAPWRRARLAGFRAPRPRTEAVWSEDWQALTGA